MVWYVHAETWAEGRCIVGPRQEGQFKRPRFAALGAAGVLSLCVKSRNLTQLTQVGLILEGRKGRKGRNVGQSQAVDFLALNDICVTADMASEDSIGLMLRGRS
ncbi:hypothetical protein K445DRAFT_16098 [Daldinia sp. EC12]|nr:hypothetical protein K445DRAFT_16098 [Daldinia sp. EC12]